MKRQLLISGLSIALLRGIGAVLAFAVTIVLGRVLGPAGFGIFAYALACLNLVGNPIVTGWVTLLVRSSTENMVNGNWSETRGIAIRGTQVSTIVTLAVLVPLFLLSVFMPGVLPGAMTPLVIALLVITLSLDQRSSIRAAVLRGLDKPALAQLPEMVVRPIVLVLGVLAFTRFFGLNISVLHAFIALLLAAGTSMLFGHHLLRRAAPEALTQAVPVFATSNWLAIVMPLATSAGLTMLNSYIDMLVLGVFSEASDIGIYRVATQFGVLAALAYTSLNILANQRFARFRAAGETSLAQAAATFMARLALICSIPLPVILLFAGDTIVEFLFGHEYVPALTAMIILTAGQSINAALGMSRTLLVMHGQEKLVMRHTAFSVLVNLFSCLVLIPVFGIEGAATANILGLAVWNLSLWRAAKRETGIDTSVAGFF